MLYFSPSSRLALCDARAYYHRLYLKEGRGILIRTHIRMRMQTANADSKWVVDASGQIAALNYLAAIGLDADLR